MYHQLSKVSGRLVASTHLQSPLFPVAPVALQRVEAPAIQYTSTHMSTVAEACPAGKTRLIPGTNTPYAPLSEKIRQRQALFQKEDDVPVFLKGGPFDGILYRFTLALCIIGLAGVGHTIFSHAVPKK
ncbi:unnamed protein product [Chrysodeixis includens]|uniref:Uncharacterized protein n=1 Tax=Chrysodeixis includens TaxID=689277 RepID=A0A9P0FPI7_CHRIL|nr:unnamed protein product [Chrysodeixis includens]